MAKLPDVERDRDRAALAGARAPYLARLEEARRHHVDRAALAARAWTVELDGPAPRGWSTAAVQRARRLAALAERTAAHRGRRAALLMSRERTARGGMGTYHRSRARAQLRRWEQVAMCETDNVLHVWAQCKGGVQSQWDPSAARGESVYQGQALSTLREACEAPRAVARCGCGVERACRLCRRELVHSKRAQAERAIAAVAELYAPELTRAVNPWAWRMATLTVPPGLGLDRDVADMASMLGDLRRWLNTWWLKEGAESEWRQLFCEQKDGTIGVRKMAPPWLAHLEIGTKNEARGGHVHAHLAICSPFIPTEVVRFYWGKALVKHGRAAHVPMVPLGNVLSLAWMRGHESWRVSQVAEALVTRRGKYGRPVELVPWPVTHIERAYGKNDGGDVARELVKYVVKDVSDGEYISVDLEADIYCALDGRRSLLSQRGLWKLGRAPSIHDQACEGCGVCEGFLVWIGPPPSPEAPTRGPPDIDDPMRALRGHMTEAPFPAPAFDGAALPYAEETPEAADLRVASHVPVDALAELLDAGIFPPAPSPALVRPRRVVSLAAARVGALVRA